MRTRTGLGIRTLTRFSVVAAFLLLSAHAAEVAGQSTHVGHGRASQARRAARPSEKRSKGARAAATPKATPRPVVYSCPMHPEVTSGAPGSCPKCRMDLEAKAPDGRDGGGSGGAPSAASHDAAQLSQPKLSAARIRQVKVYGRQGESLNLYDDLVRGRTVAFNFITAPCAAPCEQAAVFRETRRRMGERLGPYVKLITVVAGAGADWRAGLQRMAAEYGAGDEWTFVAVDEGKLTGLLDALGVPTAARAASPPPLVVYNDSAGYSTHLDGASPVTLLIKSIDDASSKDPVAPGVDGVTRLPPGR
jgi:Heavy metal binding domain